MGRIAMRVLMISDTEAIGGAGIAAARMAKALAGEGLIIGMVVNTPREGSPAGPWQRFTLRADFPVIDWEEVPDAAAEAQVMEKLEKIWASFKPDSVSVHNIHGGARFGWSPEMVRFCGGRVPTTWTLHDTWSFTGRCAYPGVCRRFSDYCDETCPTANSYPILRPGKISEGAARKRAVLGETKYLSAIAPSVWMAEMACAGAWEKRAVRVIPNCIDGADYKGSDKKAARWRLGINAQDLVILSCTADFSDSRKGAALLIKALTKVRRRPLTLLTMGRGADFPDIPGVRFRPLGFVGETRVKVQAYTASDVFVHPALEDNLPNTVMEALACNTPVAGFDIGGMRDMVCSEDAGCLAGSITPKSLALAIDTCLEQGDCVGKSQSLLSEQFSQKAFVSNWIDLVGQIKNTGEGK